VFLSAETLKSLISIDHISMNFLRTLVSLVHSFRCAKNIFGKLKFAGKLQTSQKNGRHLSCRLKVPRLLPVVIPSEMLNWKEQFDNCDIIRFGFACPINIAQVSFSALKQLHQLECDSVVRSTCK